MAPVKNSDKKNLDDATRIARTMFKYPSLWEDQAVAIASIMRGRDVFVVQRTGFGKSAVYQIPAVLTRGLTLVFSPLIALMRDQVAKLRQRGVVAEMLSSNVDENESRRILSRLSHTSILYVAPERLKNSDFLRIIRRTEISFVVVDEAHVLSHAMRDFRPAYSRIGALLRTSLAHVPRMALTATCDEAIEHDVASSLGMEDYTRVTNSPVRPNLRYEVVRERTPDEIAKIILRRFRGQRGIVYAATRARTMLIAKVFQMFRINAEHYHAGMGLSRDSVQDRFTHGDIDVIVSTNAFGMGVDIPDIRFVIHADPPNSIHDYAQESGRAGRDGHPSTCILNMTAKGIQSRRFFVRTSNPDIAHIDALWKVFSEHRVRSPFRTNTRSLGFALKGTPGANKYTSHHIAPNVLGYLEFRNAIVTRPEKRVYTFNIGNRAALATFLQQRRRGLDVRGGKVKATVYAGDDDWTNRLLASRACTIIDGEYPQDYFSATRLREHHDINSRELHDKRRAAEKRLSLLIEFADAPNPARFISQVFTGPAVARRRITGVPDESVESVEALQGE